TVYLATTGRQPWNQPSGSTQRIGLCDAVSAFPATQTAVHHHWVEYSGCDSYYSVAADSSTVYAAGHPRWADNSNGCNHAGPGADAGEGSEQAGEGARQVRAVRVFAITRSRRTPSGIRSPSSPVSANPLRRYRAVALSLPSETASLITPAPACLAQSSTARTR